MYKAKEKICICLTHRNFKNGKAYYCFCSNDRWIGLNEGENQFGGYDRHCRNLSQEEVDKLLKEGVPYVIRQKMPVTGSTTFVDAVYGEITIENSELEDQILIKSDGYPTYNFANVIDDHLMNITHVVRGCEYLTSTPKYNLLYEAFGWELPTYVHLPMIMGKSENGSVSKLSKRHGSTRISDLVNDGYLRRRLSIILRCLDGVQKITKKFLHYKGWLNIFLLTESVNHNLFLIMIS